MCFILCKKGICLIFIVTWPWFPSINLWCTGLCNKCTRILVMTACSFFFTVLRHACFSLTSNVNWKIRHHSIQFHQWNYTVFICASRIRLWLLVEHNSLPLAKSKMNFIQHVKGVIFFVYHLSDWYGRSAFNLALNFCLTLIRFCRSQTHTIVPVRILCALIESLVSIPHTQNLGPKKLVKKLSSRQLLKCYLWGYNMTKTDHRLVRA